MIKLFKKEHLDNESIKKQIYKLIKDKYTIY